MAGKVGIGTDQSQEALTVHSEHFGMILAREFMLWQAMYVTGTEQSQEVLTVYWGLKHLRLVCT